MDDLGGRLRRIRESRNLSIYEVERRTGMHFSTISKYERNERQPSLDVLRELAALYDVPVSVFLTDRLALETLLPEPLAALALQLLERPALAEACQRLATLDDPKLEALAEFLDRVGLTAKPRGAGPRRRGTTYPPPRGGTRRLPAGPPIPDTPPTDGAPDVAAEGPPGEEASPGEAGAPPPARGGTVPRHERGTSGPETAESSAPGAGGVGGDGVGGENPRADGPPAAPGLPPDPGPSAPSP
ncbi:helix-turn-helix domain-containing protein [Thermaerobacter litoralis]